MYVKDFSVENKIFAISFSKDECCKVKTGICPVEDKAELQKMQKENQKTYNRSHYSYCKKMESSFLNGSNFKSLDLYLCTCGHYHIFDGRHRICTAGHLLEKGQKVILQANVQIENSLCPYCRGKKSLLKQRKKLSLFDYVLKTRAYKNYKESISFFNWRLISFYHNPAYH